MTDRVVLKRGFAAHLAVGLFLLNSVVLVRWTCAETPAIDVGRDGKLTYATDERGNRIPDFSNCGYSGGDHEIPDVPAPIRIAPSEGDDGPRIQAAIDEVSQLPLDKDRFRGAVLLLPGQFEVAGELHIAASGVVLRGSGAGPGGTTLIGTGTDRRALIRVAGGSDRTTSRETTHAVIDEYVPVGATTLRLESTDGLSVGDTVLVARRSTAPWITSLGMDAFGVAWKPGTRDIRWDRIITRIDGSAVNLDAPITTAIDKQFGGATVSRYEWPTRIAHAGVENMRLQSEYAANRPLDEDHAWFGVVLENTQDAWVRGVEFRGFAGGAVTLWESTKRVTVEDCVSVEPVSEIGGHRRQTYVTCGQLTLFLRCWSELGRHDFAVGHCAAGPNAFVNCVAVRALGDSGPIESWASGVLYDNVQIDGGGLNLVNRWSSPPGAGWSAANCALWNCRAATMDVFRPPAASNWAIGVWARFSGDGTFESRSDSVRPLSLYQAQLHERRGAAAAAHIGRGLTEPIGATNPTVAAAREFTSQSNKPAQQLIDVIRERFDNARAVEFDEDRDANGTGHPGETHAIDKPTPGHTARPLSMQNGWLVIDGKLKTGGVIQQRFWQGTTRPDEARAHGPAITRFVPGRAGSGFSDDLTGVANWMLAGHAAVFDYHYGLWYDRRRDDHTMGRQADGDVAAPFYEQPFARSGRGQAWDGLSKYDLTTFNPWYWQRLRDFAQICDDRGLVLVHQNFFQHNILEAGAHWADCPWRPANNVNDTGFPEPPPYVGDKRIFLAEQFYDTTNEHRRALYRAYIRQCLDNFNDCTNVIQMTSAEYSGPLEFVQFWLDTVIDWESERSKDVVVGLSAPKNVQDAILADSQRAPHVDVIDIRYWAYTAGGELYAPDGGQNLAPRQHLRQTRQKAGGFSAIVRAVLEYRTRYPEKAVTYYADQHCPSGRDGWAVLMGGGSFPDVKLPVKLTEVVPTMRTVDNVVSGPGQWCLGNSESGYLIYSESTGGQIRIALPVQTVAYRASWIDGESGEITATESIANGGPTSLRCRTNVLWIERLPSN